MLYLIPHRYLPLTPILPCCIWHRYLSCYIWYLPCYMWYVTPDTDTCHAIYDMWYPTPVLVLLHLSLDIRHWFLICHTWHLLLTHGIWYAFMWYKYLDLTLWLLTGHYHTWYLWHIHGYHFYGDLIIILLPYIWYSWTPVLLYTWPPEIGEAPDITPDIILLLIPVIG